MFFFWRPCTHGLRWRRDFMLGWNIISDFSCFLSAIIGFQADLYIARAVKRDGSSSSSSLHCQRLSVNYFPQSCRIDGIMGHAVAGRSGHASTGDNEQARGSSGRTWNISRRINATLLSNWSAPPLPPIHLKPVPARVCHMPCQRYPAWCPNGARDDG